MYIHLRKIFWFRAAVGQKIRFTERNEHLSYVTWLCHLSFSPLMRALPVLLDFEMAARPWMNPTYVTYGWVTDFLPSSLITGFWSSLPWSPQCMRQNITTIYSAMKTVCDLNSLICPPLKFWMPKSDLTTQSQMKIKTENAVFNSEHCEPVNNNARLCLMEQIVHVFD